MQLQGFMFPHYFLNITLMKYYLRIEIEVFAHVYSSGTTTIIEMWHIFYPHSLSYTSLQSTTIAPTPSNHCPTSCHCRLVCLI